MPVRAPFLPAACTLLVTSLLAGCSFTAAPAASSNAPVASATLNLRGTARGGNQTIGKSKLYLYAANSGGYGLGARSITNSPGYVLTDDGGNFTITGDFTCLAGDQVYLLALGGNPGLSAGTNNGALALAAALGPCNKLSASTFIVVDEVTTVAAAYALAGYMTSATGLSSSGSALANTGIANAFLNAANLASTSTGYAYATTPAGNGTVPSAEINTLANILASCVNTDGTGSACDNLFTATTPAGGTRPSDTLQAILNIAHNPGLNVATLYGYSTAVVPFQPVLSAAPHDWSLAVIYTGGGNNSPAAVAVDGVGNIWANNFTGISELSPGGAAISPAAGFVESGNPAHTVYFGFAIDPSNHAWVTVSISTTSAHVAVLAGDGTLLSPAGGYSGGGLFAGQTTCFDPFGNFWAVSDGTHSANGQTTYPYQLSKFSPTGVALSPATGYPNSGVAASLSLASDVAGNIWSANYLIPTPTAAAFVSKTANDGSSGLDYTAGGINGPGYVAFDHAGNVWIPNNYTGTVTELDNSGNAISPSAGYTGLPFAPTSVAIDGDGRVWTLNIPTKASASTPYTLGELSSTGVVLSPSGGLQNSALVAPADFAIDGSGNLWITNYSSNKPSIAEFVGLTAPVVTPFSVAVANNALGSRP